MRIYLVVLLVVICVIPPEVEGGAYPSLRFALYMPPSSISYQKVFLPFAENVSRDSNGELNISLYPSGVLGRNPAEQTNMVRHGIVDIAVVLPSLSTDVFPGAEVTRIPGLVRNATEGSVALWQTYASMNLLQKYDVRILSMFVTYPDILHTKKQVRHINALKGLKLRISSGAGKDNGPLQELGVTPVLLPFSETYTALQMGVLDGAVMTWDLAERSKMNEVMNYHYDLPLGSTMVALVMNRKRYRKLTENARQAIDRNSGEHLAKIWGEAYDAQNAHARRKFREFGGTLTELSRDDRRQLENNIDKWINQLSGISMELGDKFLDNVKHLRNKAQ